MGRWHFSVSSELFHRETKQQRSALQEVLEIGEGQPSWNSHRHRVPDGVKRSNLTTNITTTTTKSAMCNSSGGDGDVAVVVAAPPAEEWSPIREAPPHLPPPPEHEGFIRFPAEEAGASSDMDTDDDTVPLVPRPREAAAAVGVGIPGGGTDNDAQAGASDVDGQAGSAGNVGSFAAFAAGSNAFDRFKGGSDVHTRGEPAPKRKRLPDIGSSPVVEVTYEGLNRESKNVLRQALQSWSHWHSRTFPTGKGAPEEVLQSGTEVYSPALALDPSSTSGAISVWMDKPLKRLKGAKVRMQEEKQRMQDKHDVGSVESQDKEKDVPLYDRACISPLSSHDLGNPNEYVFIEPEEASRCFNCGSYSHALRNCPRPHAMAAIRNARETLSNKRGPRSRAPSRYYQCSAGGKFDDLKPGILSVEARKAIGIGELDPPPWLNRMRKIGYPPGYFEDTEDESSGVQIFDDDTEEVAGRESIKDAGDAETLTPVEEHKTGQKMTVEYPGINAPIPENADKELWAVRLETHPVESPRGSKRPYHQISQMHNSGSGLLSPSSPANSWPTGMRDYDSRVESYIRSIANAHSESYSQIRYDEMESYIDVHGSNLYGATSHVVNRGGYMPFDPAKDWSRRRVGGTSSLSSVCNGARSGMEGYHYSPSSPSGLASPIRGMFGTPGPFEQTPSPSHTYSRHDYYQSGPHDYYQSGPQEYYQSGHQESPLNTGQNLNQAANEAWLKAQLALDALHPSQTTEEILSPPPRAHGGALQNLRGPGLPHQWGRR